MSDTARKSARIFLVVTSKAPYPQTSPAFSELEGRLAVDDFFVETTAFLLMPGTVACELLCCVKGPW